jgi:S-DNA-T family DNA segregation ATPase FtsK/SpoIIIE
MARKKKIAIGLLLAMAAVFAAVSLFSYDPRDYESIWSARNMCGPLGAILAGSLRYLFGYIFSWAVPAIMFYIGIMATGGGDLGARKRLLILLGTSVWLVSAITGYAGAESAAGIVGVKTQAILRLIIGRIGTILALSVSLLLILAAVSFKQLRRLASSARRIRLPRLRKPGIAVAGRENAKSRSGRKKAVVSITTSGAERPAPQPKEEKVSIDIPEAKPARPKPVKKPSGEKRKVLEAGAVSTPADGAPLPELSLLDDYDESSVEFSREDLIARSEMIEDKLLVYGLKGKVQKVLPGPVVTTFEFVPSAGVKVSQIASRSDDLSLALAARSLRIEAPIPGKSAVGIEVPNPEPKLVLLKEMMEHFPDKSDGLMVVLGKTVTGDPCFADIADMPHLLIAGATGSGKSVCINSIICSLLFTHTPATCRFILVDPKRLELITYNDIPHLLHPVITEARPTLKVLNWLTIEMDRRYRLLAQLGVKNIQSFNRKAEEKKLVHPETGDPLTCLPFYVTIIDELADLMVSLGNEIYPPITRLSQMARAVGIHLVFATQRPSVDVVTGLIKANFPTRIAFQVTSKIDSRTILDVNGAETLLGNGDMLYLPKNLPSPVRLQGAYISESEARNVADYWRSFKDGSEKINLSDSMATIEGEDTDIDDELYEKAKELVIIHQQGSISLVQRRLRVGYARAARLIDMLEQSGVVGPFEGSKAREVLISREEYEQSR